MSNRDKLNTGLGSYDYDAGPDETPTYTHRLDDSEVKGLVGPIA